MPKRTADCEGRTMKAITLTQPYASLVALGAKRIEHGNRINRDHAGAQEEP